MSHCMSNWFFFFFTFFSLSFCITVSFARFFFLYFIAHDLIIFKKTIKVLQYHGIQSQNLFSFSDLQQRYFLYPFLPSLLSILKCQGNFIISQKFNRRKYQDFQGKNQEGISSMSFRSTSVSEPKKKKKSWYTPNQLTLDGPHISSL